MSSHTGQSTAASRIDPFDWIAPAAKARAEAGLVRRPRTRAPQEDLLDLAGNDYLGLARHTRVTSAAAVAAQRWGAGATGSRLVTGTIQEHVDLEHELAAFCGTAAALAFSSGYLANISALTTLTDRDTLVISDAVNHASLIDGCRLSRAQVHVVAHGDLDAADRALATRTQQRALVVTDAVFSVDGNQAPLNEWSALCLRHGAGLIVDDAHGLGVVGPGGRGAAANAGLTEARHVVITATLSKALGAQGGVVLADADVVEHLMQTARGFIFDTGLAPASAGAALEAVRLLREHPELAQRCAEVAAGLHTRLRAAGLTVSEPRSAVVSVRAPSPQQAADWAARCRDAGVVVGCFRPPSVPDGVARLRLTARADLEAGDLDHAAEIIAGTAP